MLRTNPTPRTTVHLSRACKKRCEATRKMQRRMFQSRNSLLATHCSFPATQDVYIAYRQTVRLCTVTNANVARCRTAPKLQSRLRAHERSTIAITDVTGQDLLAATRLIDRYHPSLPLPPWDAVRESYTWSYAAFYR